VTCDSCGGLIGGPRLFCLDCAIKSTELYDSLDLCCAPKCVSARVTRRRDLEGVHEPNHRLVKVRTPVLMRSHGRVHTAACNAFEHVGETCRRVAELTLRSGEETGPDGRNTLESALTKMSAKTFKLDDMSNRLDGSKCGAGLGGKTVREARQVQVLDQSLPTCGKCKGRLSFPFWYCIFCKGKFPRMTSFPGRAERTFLHMLDDLYICNACDAAGVPDLIRSSGNHTEKHHLIRCLAPGKADGKASLTERRLTSIEGRLDGMQTQLDGLTGRMGDLTDRVGDLNSRLGNVEQLLHRLVRVTEGRAA